MKSLIILLSTLFLCENAIAAGAGDEGDKEGRKSPVAAADPAAKPAEEEESSAKIKGASALFKGIIEGFDGETEKVDAINTKVKAGEEISDEDQKIIKDAINSMKPFLGSGHPRGMDIIKQYSGILLGAIKVYVDAGGKLDEDDTKTYTALCSEIEPTEPDEQKEA